MAAAPAIQFFRDWPPPYDRVFELSTPIDQSVTSDGYRVTVVRAYADVYSLRLGILIEDLGDRGWGEINVDSMTVRDDDGLAYRPGRGVGRQPTPESSQGWYEFAVPADGAADGPQRIAVDIDTLEVRRVPAPTLANGDIDPDGVGTTVNGAWSFEFDLVFFAA